MIIRCSNCGSAFSVDDSKIDQKKFAFNCPGCKAHNIIDNRERKGESELKGAILDSSPDKGESGALMDDGFSADDKQAENPAETGGLETEEQFAEPIQDAIPAEVDDSMPAPEESLLQADTMTSDEELDTFTDDEIAVLGQDTTDGETTSPDTAGTDTAPIEEPTLDELAEFDDIASLDQSGEQDGTSSPLDADLTELADLDNDDILQDLDAMESELSGVAVGTEDEAKSMEMNGFDDFDITSTEETTPDPEIVPQDDIGFEDELADELAEIEALDAQLAVSDETPSIDDDESISLEDAGLTLDDVELSEEEADQIQMDGETAAFDDFDSFQPLEEDIPGAGTGTLDTIVNEGTTDFAETPAELPASEPDLSASEEEVDESITIDLDSLDIQLDDEEGVTKEPIPDDIESDEFTLDTREGTDDIGTFDTDDLSSAELTDMSDDELEDITAEIVSNHDEPELSEITAEPALAMTPEPIVSDISEIDDGNITIDLDSLDIPLVEDEEMKEGEVVEDDERLNLGDAGLTVDELAAEAGIAGIEEGPLVKEEFEEFNEEDDLRLSIDEIDPELDVDSILAETETNEPLLENDIAVEEMPEIDIDKFTEDDDGIDAIVPMPITTTGETEDFLDIGIRDSNHEYRRDMEDEELAPSDVVPNGIINFSLDYSLKYSRAGAVLRLLGLYPLRLIPHFIVTFIYTMLSGIVGALNWLIILFTGTSIEDFLWIQENTIRYILSLGSCAADVVEDLPKYAGKKDIDHSLQFDVTYPSRPSRLLAFLRLTGIGIIVLALPHLVILTLLSLGFVLIYLVGLISIIATGNWPGVIFDFMIRYYRYTANVLAFMAGLIDKYPTFRFE